MKILFLHDDDIRSEIGGAVRNASHNSHKPIAADAVSREYPDERREK